MSKQPLRIENLSISLGETPIMQNVSLEIQAGNIVSFMGASGSGKSTFLSWLCGTISKEFSYSGHAFLGEKEISVLPCWQRGVGILFQDDLLFSHMSVAGNLAFGLPAGLSKKQKQEQIDQALFHAGMECYGKCDSATLSAGQRVRIALMRCLLAQPKMLLLDEPFSKLDIALRKKFRTFVFSHAAKADLPIILVTHDPEDAKAAGGKIFTMPLISSDNIGNKHRA